MSANFADQLTAWAAAKGETTAAMLHTPSNGKKLLKLNSQFALCSLLLILLATLGAGCSSIPLPSLPSLPWSSPSSQPNATAETLYKEAVELLNNKKYAAAIDRFQKLRSDYPFAPEVVPAELKLGEAYYFNKQYPEAIETLKEFQAMHPGNENVPYALYLSGMANFDQFSAVDRDQKTTETAKGYFERVVNNYPNSPYAAKAQEKLAKCLEYLAEHEFDIASFYMREKKYPAARDRFEEILRRYRNTPTAAKALYQLGESYRLEKNNVKAALAYEAFVQYYPNHPQAGAARAQLSQLAQEKQDPLAILLKPEGRPAPPALAENKDQAGEAKPPLNFVAKTEVVNENPGDEKGLLGRVVDKINPFSSSSPAPSTNEAEKKDQSAVQASTNGAAKKDQSDGFFSSLWPFGKKQETASDGKTAAAKNPQLIGGIDESLKQRGIEAKPQVQNGRTGGAAKENFDLQPPPADLPQITETNLSSATDPTSTLSTIDSKLEKKGKSMSDLPPPPEAAPAIKAPANAPTVQRSKAASTPDTGALLSNIDQKLQRQGIDATKAEEAIETENRKKKESGAVVVSRPKPPEQIQLEPRLSTDKSPLLLQPQEFQPQEKSTVKAEPDKSAPGETPAVPNSATTQPQTQTLPELAVKGPPQPVKEKPAETKAAAKPKSGDQEEDVEENKSVFEQLKEDFGRIGKILNPFSW